jgi:hypothetical protein
MDAFTVADELIRGTRLTADQLAQLRAINHRHFSRMYALTRDTTDAAARGNVAPAPRPLTRRETSQLRAMLVEDVLQLLTPRQRSALDDASDGHS